MTDTLTSTAAMLLIQDGPFSYEVPLDAAVLTVGRAMDNGLVLRSRVVSAYHARIEPAGSGHIITDMGSTNGLLYHGQPLHGPYTLYDGDVVRIGDMASGSFVSLTYRNVQAIRAQHRQHYPLDAPTITIGRGADCTIRLDSLQLSRHHARIEQLYDGQHVLHDTGSANSTFVNGLRVSKQRLHAGDVIQVGPFRLTYNGDRLSQSTGDGLLVLAADEVGYQAGEHTILHPLSLIAEPGELVAVVGGSGAGKSTLLRLLTGELVPTDGRVLCNGIAQAPAPGTAGYVPQHPLLHTTLPVAEALTYTARLRLPNDTPPGEIAQRIAAVLAEVGLSDQHQQIIGQLSGGQRKRVDIAAELLAQPALLVLDEPTSGLDPGLEKQMMYLLRRIADSGACGAADHPRHRKPEPV
ncbi:MAG: FHA domain-containing protein [Chloroflexaceae bacterium]|nr:FHA domain-containing protein [Chloroflexaceae bacterium]